MSSGADPLLTVDDVLRMIAERDSHMARAAELDAQIGLVRRLLGEDRFQRFAGDKGAPLSLAPAPAKRRPNTMRSAILNALEGKENGLTYNELRPLLDEVMASYSPNSFFNSVASLAQRKEVVKVGNRLFSPSAYSALSEDRLSEIAAMEKRETAPEAVVGLLRIAGRPLPAGDIVDKLAASHPYVKATAIYATLSRLAKDRDLVRDENGRYSLGKAAEGDRDVNPASLF